jgi:cytidine deaminase
VTATLPATDVKALVEAAVKAAQNAYVPYSHYQVGAALRAADGTIYGGCNVENASYPASICAERTALVKAISEGQRQFEAIVVATRNGGFPCGICRQMLYEFAPHMQVIIADLNGKILHHERLSDLLLHGFGPSELGK